VQGSGLALLWTLSLSITVYVGLYPGRVHNMYLPFLASWTGVAILLPILAGSTLERLRLRTYVLPALILLAPALYYVVGRPIEMEALQRQTPFRLDGTFFDPTLELFLPISVGTGLVALYGVAYWVIRRVRSETPFKYVFVAGVAMYLLTGLLLWVHAVTAWLFVNLASGVPPSPVQQPWLRFVDEAGPHLVWWHIFSWPAAVVGCCG
jgi:hypothetical protein